MVDHVSFDECALCHGMQTDACYEPYGDNIIGGIGGVLFAPDGKPFHFFSQRLSQELVAALHPGCRKTTIYECEFFALSCALLIWGSLVSNAVVVYTDNNAVRDAMTSCHTTNVVAKRVLVTTLSLECDLQLTPWYARVSTDSNLADSPSRLVIEPLLRMGAKQSDACAEGCWNAMVTRVDSWGDDRAT